jgi:endoglucanase
MTFLEVKGRELRDGDGRKVMLRGVCLGGWLNMENFITGFTGTEQELRRALRDELGAERHDAFFRGFLGSFIAEEDFAFLKSMGATVARIPFNYRHLEDDERPGQFRPDGFHHLDRAVAWAKKHGIHVILDLHAAQGGQNEGWHSDNPLGVALLWQHPHFQDRVRDLWVHVARHYRDEPAVAGYDLINEPNAPSVELLNRVYREWTEAIRAVDRKHLLFLEGNFYSQIFEGFDEPYDAGTVYSSHNYSLASFRARRYPGQVGSVFYDRARHEADFLKQNRWLLDREVPAWVGEFGPIFDGPVDSPTASDRDRLQVLADQLAIFNEHGHHWTYWTYKDIGPMGMVVPAPECEYLERLQPFLDAKDDLGLDAWTSRRSGILDSDMRAIVDRVVTRLGEYSIDLEQLKRRLTNTGVYAILAGALTPRWAHSFADMSPPEIERMAADAFRFERCRQRTAFLEVMMEAMR